MQSRDEETGAPGIVLSQPARGPHGIFGSWDDDRLQRRSKHAFNRALPFCVHLEHVGECADEVKVACDVCLREGKLHGRRIICASPVEFVQALEPVSGPRVFVTHTRQFRICVADRFVTLDHGVNRRLALGIQLSDVLARDESLIV